MTQEDKELLLQDLSGRLPHGVLLCNSLDVRCGKKPFALSKINHRKGNVYVQEEAGGPMVLDEYGGWIMNDKYFLSDFTKPYLRSLSSMTEEEFEELKEYSGLKYDQLDLASFPNNHKCLDFYLSEVPAYVVILVYDWLNSHHFDYRGLIEKGLAIAVTDENNPYE